MFDHIPQSLAVHVVHGPPLLYILRNPLLRLLRLLRFRSEVEVSPWPKEDICSDTKQKGKTIETKEVSLVNSQIADISMGLGRS